MLLFCVVLLASAQTVFAVIGDDLSCTVTVAGAPQYSFQSTMCGDAAGSDECLTLLGGAGVVAGKDDARPTKCYEDSSNVASPSAKAFAIKNCAAYCGFCCLTDQFDCENKPIPALPCDQITKQQCQDPNMKTLIENNCPASCGFCDDNGCFDLDNSGICGEEEDRICLASPDFAAKYCRRTCRYCTSYGGSVSTTKTPLTVNPGVCVDNSNCYNWNQRGFCNSTFYNPADKQKYCPKTCGFC